tara:strand:- start:204 stop:998 length:795 start_codon:yes stop_codon:yes gene_type:complete
METKEKVAKKAPIKKETKPVDNWEYKIRRYFLLGGKKPLTHTIPSRHSTRYPLVWFDKDLGYERELRYATNQKSVFVDEQSGNATLKHVIFEDGILVVPAEKRNLQEFLLHHPHRGLIFGEFNPQAVAVNEYEELEYEIEAMNTAYAMDLEHGEAILRVEIGSDVSKLTSKELKRDLLLFAKRQPELFLDLANDENVILRNFAIRSVEENIIELSPDNRTFSWKSNGRKLMNVPFDENPYSAMAAWFKTDEGLEVYRSIDKKFK